MIYHEMTLLCSSHGWGVWPACYQFKVTYKSHLSLQWQGACRSELMPWDCFSWVFDNHCRPQSKSTIHHLHDAPLTRQCTDCSYEHLSVLCLECAPVSMIEDPLETPNCFINWGTSGPWRAGVMPTCKLCDSKGHAKKLPQRAVQAVMMMKPWTEVTALELTPIVHHSPMWSLCRHEEEWFLINSCLLSKKKKAAEKVS